MGAPPVPEWLPILMFIGIVGGLLFLLHMFFDLAYAVVRGILWLVVRIRERRADSAPGSWAVDAAGDWVAGPCEVQGCRWPRGHRRPDHMFRGEVAPDEELVR